MTLLAFAARASRACRALQPLKAPYLDDLLSQNARSRAGLSQLVSLLGVGSTPARAATAVVATSCQHYSAGACDTKAGEKPFRSRDAEILMAAERIMAPEPCEGSINQEDQQQDSISKTEPPSEDFERVVAEHMKRIGIIDARNKKRPSQDIKTMKSWVEENAENLIPFQAFCRKHGIDAERAVASLFTLGLRGRTIMLPRAVTAASLQARPGPPKQTPGVEAPRKEDSEPWEVSFAAWTNALRAEDLPHSLPALLARWPRLLAKDPSQLPATMAILEETLQDDAILCQAVFDHPILLVQSPMELQKRLLTLQMATAGILPILLCRLPQLLHHNFEHVLCNIRLLREHSRTPREFRRVITYKPQILIEHPNKLYTFVKSTKTILGESLPSIIEPLQVLLRSPQLVLIPWVAIRDRWAALVKVVDSLPEWKEEMEGYLEEAALAPPLQGSQDVGEMGPPAWVHLAPKDAPVGIKAVNGSISNTSKPRAPSPEQDDIWAASKGDIEGEKRASEEAAEEYEEEEDDVPGAGACLTLGELMAAAPFQFDRLVYLLEQVPEKAVDISFADAVLVSRERFANRFPEFYDWSLERRAGEAQTWRQKHEEE